MQYTVKEASKRARFAAFYLGYPNVAIVFGSTIYLWNIKREHFLNDKKHLAHELCHVAQFRKYGFLRFLILYCWESLIHGYYNNKFEIEARAAESTTEQ